MQHALDPVHFQDRAVVCCRAVIPFEALFGRIVQLQRILHGLQQACSAEITMISVR